MDRWMTRTVMCKTFYAYDVMKARCRCACQYDPNRGYVRNTCLWIVNRIGTETHRGLIVVIRYRWEQIPDPGRDLT